MATYPAFPQAVEGHTWEPESGFEWERADDGTMLGRSLFTADKYRGHIRHPRISTADKDTLMTFWDTNKGTKVDFVLDSDGQTYSVYMLAKPTATWRAPNQWDVDVDLAT